jgi:hypothetical protein
MKHHEPTGLVALICILAILNVNGCSEPPEPGLVDQDANVRVEILGTKIGPVIYQAKDRRGKLEPRANQAKEPFLQITIEVLNNSQTKKLVYSGWCEDANQRKRATLADDHGNSYSPKLHSSAVLMTNVEVAGHHTGSLYPGSSMNDVLIFEVPVDTASFLTLTLPKSAYDETQSGSLKLRFPTSSIQMR